MITNILIDGESYQLDIEQAKKLGVIRKNITFGSLVIGDIFHYKKGNNEGIFYKDTSNTALQLAANAGLILGCATPNWNFSMYDEVKAFKDGKFI